MKVDMTKISPLPWAVYDYSRIQDARGQVVARDVDLSGGDLAYIVQACNAYPKLVAHIKAMLSNEGQLGASEDDGTIWGDAAQCLRELGEIK